jgi:hypothetical protein
VEPPPLPPTEGAHPVRASAVVAASPPNVITA